MILIVPIRRSKHPNMRKIFFDANILLDLLITNRTNHHRALQSLPHILERYEILATSEDILTTIEYIASRQKIPCERTAAFFGMLQEEFDILNFTSVLPKVLPIYAHKCKQGEPKDFEDLMQLHCAMEAGCDTFLTEDQGIAEEAWDIRVVTLMEFSP